MTTPKNMVIGEVKALLQRWGEESDLNDEELLECIYIAVAEYYHEEVVDFESDITIDEDE